MNNLIHLWKAISYLGTGSERAELVKKEIILSNQLSIALIPITILLLLFNLTLDHHPILLGLFLNLIVVITVPTLNSFGKIVISRLMFSILPNICLILPILFLKEIDSGNSVGLSYTVVAISLLPLLLFNFRLETPYFLVALMVNIFAVFSHDIFLQLFDVEVIQSNDELDFLLYKLPQLYLFIVVMGTYFIFQRVNTSYQQELVHANDDLKEKNSLIQDQNHELVKKQDEILKQGEVIADQHRTLQERTERLDNHRKVLQELTQNELVQHGVLFGALEEISRKVSYTLPVANVSVWINEDDRLRCLRAHNNVQTHTHEGHILNLEELPNFHKTLLKEDIIDAQDVKSDARLSGILALNPGDNVVSSLTKSFFIDGQLAGIIICEHFGEQREWSIEEINFLKAISDIIVLVMRTVDIKEESEKIRQQNQEIKEKNKFIEVQKELIVKQNGVLTEQKEELGKSLKELQQTQRALALKEAESRSILDAVKEHNLVAEYDLDGDVIWFNQKILDYLGLTLDDVIKKNRSEFDAFIQQGDKKMLSEFEKFWDKLRKGTSVQRETKFKVKDGEIWVSSTFLPIKDETGKTQKIMAIGQDITQTKRQQEQIEEQNQLLKSQQEEIVRINGSLEKRVKERTARLQSQNEQLVEYAFINAHLLRAPVCNILGLVDLLNYNDLDADTEEIVHYLNKSSFELDEIVKKINNTIQKGYFAEDEQVSTPQ
jgi:PAS domain S-box-containing protein